MTSQRDETAVTRAADPGEPALVTGEPPGRDEPLAGSGMPGADHPDTIPSAALAEQQWPAILALFVDDPRGAVERAAAVAGEVARSIVATVQREQADLRASWPEGADTEDLRTALQRYRAFCGRLEDLA
jgi:hypothetical protein